MAASARPRLYRHRRRVNRNVLCTSNPVESALHEEMVGQDFTEAYLRPMPMRKFD